GASAEIAQAVGGDADEALAFSAVIYALASGLPGPGSRGDTRLRLFRLQCKGPRLAAELYVDLADRVTHFRGSRTARRGEAEDDRRCVGIDEPGDAADVAVVGQFLFGFTIPELPSAGH